MKLMEKYAAGKVLGEINFLVVWGIPPLGTNKYQSSFLTYENNFLCRLVCNPHVYIVPLPG